MITEQDKLNQEKDELLKKHEFNASILLAAAKYERLVENRDFQGILNDLKGVKEVLDNEINLLSRQLVMTEDPTDRATVLNEFMTKATRRLVIEEAISYPSRIIHQAVLAREENVIVRGQLKEKFNAEP